MFFFVLNIPFFSFFWYKTNSIYVYMFKKESSVISWLEYVENKFNKSHCSFCFSLYFFLFTLTFWFLILWFVIGLLLILWYLLLILSCFIREWHTQFKSFLNHFFFQIQFWMCYTNQQLFMTLTGEKKLVNDLKLSNKILRKQITWNPLKKITF